MSSLLDTKTARKSRIEKKKKKKKKKKKLKNHTKEDFGLPGQEKVLIKSTLCHYYKVLWSKSKKLITYFRESK